MDLTLIIVIIILIIIAIVVYSSWNKTQIVLSNLKSGTVATTITSSTLPTNSASSNYAYSIWFYVTNWQYRLTEKKVILTRTDGTNFNPEISFSPYENNINVSVSTYPLSQDTSLIAPPVAPAVAPAVAPPVAPPVAPAVVPAPSSASGTMNSTSAPVPGSMYSPPSNAISSIYDSTIGSLSSSISGFQNQDPSASATTQSCLIRNFPIQKWSNLIISLNGRTMDIYLDGKLVRTCILPGVAINNPDADVSITPDGGFAGWTSNLQYFANTLNPQEAYNIYKKGYSAGGLGGIFDKYKVKVSYLVNNEEANSFEF